jgi:hypothetical protein
MSSSCKVPLLFSGFKENLNFSTEFQKILKYQISRISVQWQSSGSPVAADWIRADGKTGHDEANSSVSQFCERD